MAALIAVAICLAACLRQAPLSGLPELSALDLDVTKFLQITLRDEVEVTAAEIRIDNGGPPRTRAVALEYVEHENRKGYVPDQEVEYTNLYLVSQVERIGEDRETIKDRYLVINLWHYYPSRGVKTCHMWVVWDGTLHPIPPHASFQLLVVRKNSIRCPFRADELSRLLFAGSHSRRRTQTPRCLWAVAPSSQSPTMHPVRVGSPRRWQ